jgi:hypothetical protein
MPRQEGDLAAVLDSLSQSLSRQVLADACTEAISRSGNRIGHCPDCAPSDDPARPPRVCGQHMPDLVAQQTCRAARELLNTRG